MSTLLLLMNDIHVSKDNISEFTANWNEALSICAEMGMINSYIDFKGVIEDDILTANVHLPVTLNQAVFVEYKHRFLWWRWKVKAVHQTITSDNPYVEIGYSEYVKIEK